MFKTLSTYAFKQSKQSKPSWVVDEFDCLIDLIVHVQLVKQYVACNQNSSVGQTCNFWIDSVVLIVNEFSAM